ncbi:MAG: type II toxin-antitoxin system VapC family toxin [Moraxellaceae bacterium]|nr:MAG: type II toxin-antitoxin system VapC family toxin [Moraxellaceae bacterium]
MIYMVDTNILIYQMKNMFPQIAARINMAEEQDAQLVMSFVTYTELLKGAENSTQKLKVLKRIAQLSEKIKVVYPNNSKICQHYATQFQQLKQAGTPIGNHDLWIACHALAEQAVLVTHNVREFQRIEGLVIEDWVE